MGSASWYLAFDWSLSQGDYTAGHNYISNPGSLPDCIPGRLRSADNHRVNRYVDRREARSGCGIGSRSIISRRRSTGRGGCLRYVFSAMYPEGLRTSSSTLESQGFFGCDIDTVSRAKSSKIEFLQAPQCQQDAPGVDGETITFSERVRGRRTWNSNSGSLR